MLGKDNCSVAILYFILNAVSGVSIVFANKAVFVHFDFQFVSALACVHSVVTVVGLQVLCWGRVFTRKRLPWLQTIPLAAAFVGYIAGWNLTLQMNSIGFCQMSKVMVTPATACVDYFLHGKYLSKMEMAAITVLSGGVALATVTDYNMGGSLAGLLVGGLSICVTAVYQVCRMEHTLFLLFSHICWI